MTLARWTQPSGPLCLWQCFFHVWTLGGGIVLLSLFRQAVLQPTRKIIRISYWLIQRGGWEYHYLLNAHAVAPGKMVAKTRVWKNQFVTWVWNKPYTLVWKSPRPKLIHHHTSPSTICSHGYIPLLKSCGQLPGTKTIPCNLKIVIKINN